MSLTASPCSHVWAPTELSYFTTGVASVLCVITITGNVLVCLAVYKDPHKKLRTPFMFILVNLAVTDLVVGVITLPVIVATHALEAIGQKKDGHVIVARMTYFISKSASILNLTAFCVDRYVAINWPIKYRRLLNTRVCFSLFSSIWILAVAISCLYYAVGFMNFMVAFAQISFFLVLVICVVTYRLLKTLSKFSRERKSITNSTKLHRKSDRRVTKLFLTILFMFFVCYTPAIVFMYIIKFCVNCNCVLRHVIRDLQFLFICSNSAVNPFLCTIRLKPFRHALSTIFHIKSSLDGRESPPTPSISTFRRLSNRLSALFINEDEQEEENQEDDALMKLKNLSKEMIGSGEEDQKTDMHLKVISSQQHLRKASSAGDSEEYLTVTNSLSPNIQNGNSTSMNGYLTSNSESNSISTISSLNSKNSLNS